jgi:hypothetical protein
MYLFKYVLSNNSVSSLHGTVNNESDETREEAVIAYNEGLSRENEKDK